MTETRRVVAAATIHLPGQAQGHPPGTELDLPAELAAALLASGVAAEPPQASLPLAAAAPEA